jgi:hypothetical protein
MKPIKLSIESRASRVAAMGGCLFVLFMVCEGVAHAYLDPGSGSMLIQLVVAAVAGALLSVRLFWQRLKLGVMSIFTRSSGEETGAEGEAPIDRKCDNKIGNLPSSGRSPDGVT